jgi:hypothetical protein
MVEPPVDAGAVHVKFTEVLLEIPATEVGAPGVVTGAGLGVVAGVDMGVPVLIGDLDARNFKALIAV